MQENEVNAAGRLWRTVILRALEDALTAKAIQAGELPASRVSPALYAAGRAAAAWIMAGGKDFRTVCTLADVEPEAVQAAIRRLSLDEFRALHPTSKRSIPA